MNGPEHYRDAEWYLNFAECGAEGEPAPQGNERSIVIATAQVHATLALAAAQLESAYATDSPWFSDGWREVAS